MVAPRLGTQSRLFPARGRAWGPSLQTADLETTPWLTVSWTGLQPGRGSHIKAWL